MSKNIYLHLFVALLVLGWSHAFTSRLLEEREHHIPEKHHTIRRHASRRNNRYLDEDLKAEPSSTGHRYVRKEPVSDAIQDNIQDVFNLNENSEGSRQLVKRESSGPTFHQSNSVPGAFINNYFHQYQQPQQPQQLQQPQQFQQQQQPYYAYQQPQPYMPYNPYGFGLAPIIFCLCCYQQPKVPETNSNSNNGSKIDTPTRFDDPDAPQTSDNDVNGNFRPTVNGDNSNGNVRPSDIDGNSNGDNYYGQFINTLTGISLEKVPPKRNDSRRPPPIAHGVESNAIVPPYNAPLTSRPVFQQTTTTRPVQRPQRPNQQRPIPRPTQRPITQRPPASGSSQGKADRTSCAIAILQCCVNNRYSERCFSARGCPGPFFDNPCSSDLAIEASKFLNSDSVLFAN